MLIHSRFKDYEVKMEQTPAFLQELTHTPNAEFVIDCYVSPHPIQLGCFDIKFASYGIVILYVMINRIIQFSFDKTFLVYCISYVFITISYFYCGFGIAYIFYGVVKSLVFFA